MKYTHVIIGSGPTGLGAAYRLKELGITNFIVQEKENCIGGLSKSIVDDKGFTWDVGGHVQFSHYAYFDDLMNKAVGMDRGPLRAISVSEQHQVPDAGNHVEMPRRYHPQLHVSHKRKARQFP